MMGFEVPPDDMAFLKTLSAQQMIALLRDEPPKVVGAVLNAVSPPRAAQVMAEADLQIQRQLVQAMRDSRGMAPSVVATLVQGVRDKWSHLQGGQAMSPESAPRPWIPRGLSSNESPSPEREPVSLGHANPEQEDAARRRAAMANALKLAKEKQSAIGRGGGGAHTPSKGQKVDGMALAAEILRLAPSDVRDMVSREDPNLYGHIRDRMFTFDDLEMSDGRTLARVFHEVPVPAAALALRFASSGLHDRVLAAVGERRRRLIEEEAESGACERVRVSDIEAAQQEVIECAKRLQAAGQVLIDPNDPDLMG